MTHYRNFRVNEKTNVRVPMMTNKGNYLAAADHELECDILQVGGLTLTWNFNLESQFPDKHACWPINKSTDLHNNNANFLIVSSHTQETSACSLPCLGRSLAWGPWSRRSLPLLSTSGSKTWQTGRQRSSNKLMNSWESPLWIIICNQLFQWELL